MVKGVQITRLEPVRPWSGIEIFIKVSVGLVLMYSSSMCSVFELSKIKMGQLFGVASGTTGKQK